MTEAPPTLRLGGWSSRCSVCGKGADPFEETHDTVLGYFPKGAPPPAGCGVRWTHVSADYIGGPVHRTRPDLILVEWPV